MLDTLTGVYITTDIFYDKEKTKEIEQKLWDKYGKQEKEWTKIGYNVSECTYCEMKCYNQRTGLKPKITKQAIGFLVFGIISESIITAIFPEDQRQYEANLHDIIWGHLDVFESFKYPIEGKATAKRIFKRDQLPVNWIMQLINYITMTGTKQGWLLILNLFTRNIAAWCIKLTEEEKLMQIEVLMDKVSRFDKSIPKKDNSLLKVCPEEYDLCHFKTKCSRRIECRNKHKELKKQEKKEKKK